MVEEFSKQPRCRKGRISGEQVLYPNSSYALHELPCVCQDPYHRKLKCHPRSPEPGAGCLMIDLTYSISSIMKASFLPARDASRNRSLT